LTLGRLSSSSMDFQKWYFPIDSDNHSRVHATRTAIHLRKRIW